jgi:hypothetical protein
MANAIYPKYKEALLSGASDISLTTGTVKAILIDTADYTYSAAHDMLDDVPSAARVGTTAAFANKTVTSGTFDADDATASLVTGDVSEAIIIYIDTGTESTSRLVAYLDTGVTGLPVTPNGGNIIMAWNASGIFSL